MIFPNNNGKPRYKNFNSQKQVNPSKNVNLSKNPNPSIKGSPSFVKKALHLQDKCQDFKNSPPSPTPESFISYLVEFPPFPLVSGTNRICGTNCKMLLICDIDLTICKITIIYFTLTHTLYTHTYCNIPIMPASFFLDPSSSY